MFDSKTLFIIKVAVIVQVILILLLLLLSYSAEFYFKQKAKADEKKKQKINEILKNKKTFNDTDIHYLKKNYRLLLDVLPNSGSYDKNAMNMLEQKVILPVARSLSHSRTWFRRYQAIRGYEHVYTQQDEPNIIRLIKDDVLLISINAARIASKQPTITTVNTIINTLSKGRYLQQNTFVDILNDAPNDIIPLIEQNLENITDPYARAFSYRLLTSLPDTQSKATVPEQDLKTNNVELKLALLKYFAHIKDSRGIDYIYNNLNSDSWEVRAASAKLLGALDYHDAIGTLTELLKDPVWYVRVNAAFALKHMGKSGVNVLENQAADSDNFAYDVSQYALKIGQ